MSRIPNIILGVLFMAWATAFGFSNGDPGLVWPFLAIVAVAIVYNSCLRIYRKLQLGR